MLLKHQQHLQRQRDAVAFRMKKLAAKQVEITVSQSQSVLLSVQVVLWHHVILLKSYVVEILVIGSLFASRNSYHT